MARHGFGRGEYKYFGYPLPELIGALRTAIYPRLAPIAKPDRDFTGGAFVMTEQRPRMQSRPIVVPMRKGDAAVIAVHHRPVQGTGGAYRVNLRHGVSRVRSGHRRTAGIIFHDAA